MLQDEPNLNPGLEIYQAGFWRLNTTRQCGMTIGPIPDDRLEDRMDRWGIEGWADRWVFEQLINAQDLAYLNHRRQEAAPKKPGQQQPGTGGPVGWVKKKLGRK